jgi:hypothetical protein
MAEVGIAWDDGVELQHPRLPSDPELRRLADALRTELGRPVPVAAPVDDLSRYACREPHRPALFTLVPTFTFHPDCPGVGSATRRRPE